MPHEERENQIRVVLDNVSDGVISIDTAGRITTINRIARKVFDCDHREMIGKSVKNLNLADAKRSVSTAFFSAMKSEEASKTRKTHVFSILPVPDRSKTWWHATKWTSSSIA